MERRELEQFCRAEYPRLIGVLGLFCGDWEAAEALAEETMARVWRRWDQPRAHGDLATWSRRVAFNLARKCQPPSGAALAGLSGLQRAIVILRSFEGRSIADTAGLLGVTEDDVRAVAIRDLHDAAVPEPTRPLDVEALAQRARRFRLRFRLTALAVCLVLLLGLALLARSGRSPLRPRPQGAGVRAPAARVG